MRGVSSPVQSPTPTARATTHLRDTAASWVTRRPERLTAHGSRSLEFLPGTIRSGRETWLVDAAATPRPRVRVLMPGPMEDTMRESEQAPALRCTRSSFVGCYRRHVDLQRVASAVCPG